MASLSGALQRSGETQDLGFTHRRETWDEMVDDIKPLLHDHWEELALYKDDIPLDPDFEQYRAIYDAGILRPYGTRLNGKLIGYALFTVTQRHPHYKHRWAINDIIFIHPDHRNFGCGSGLFDCFEKELNSWGPVVIHITGKTDHPELAMLLTARGYGHVEFGYSKRFT